MSVSLIKSVSTSETKTKPNPKLQTLHLETSTNQSNLTPFHNLAQNHRISIHSNITNYHTKNQNKK